MTHPLVRKLSQLAPLSAEEKEVLVRAATNQKAVQGHHDLVAEGDHPTQCILILEGMACRYKLLANGVRQILSFQVAGDLCDLQSVSLERMDHSVATITPCTVAFIPHQTVLEWTETYPRLTRALWRDTLIDAAVFREWIANVGARPAHSRLAHLICEILVRLESVGLVTEQSYRLPLTQTDIADAIGVSHVHANRLIQKLRREDLITLEGGTLTVLDWDRLRTTGQFDPAYLHMMGNA